MSDTVGEFAGPGWVGLGPRAETAWQSGMRAASNRIVPLRASTAGPSRGARQCRRQYLSSIPTDEGFLYLAAVKDLATRQIVGWSMAEHLQAGLCIDALVMALQRCRPPRGLIHHSDRGVQYAAGPYRAVLERHGIQPSM